MGRGRHAATGEPPGWCFSNESCNVLWKKFGRPCNTLAIKQTLEFLFLIHAGFGVQQLSFNILGTLSPRHSRCLPHATRHSTFPRRRARSEALARARQRLGSKAAGCARTDPPMALHARQPMVLENEEAQRPASEEPSEVWIGRPWVVVARRPCARAVWSRP